MTSMLSDSSTGMSSSLPCCARSRWDSWSPGRARRTPFATAGLGVVQHRCQQQAQVLRVQVGRTRASPGTARRWWTRCRRWRSPQEGPRLAVADHQLRAAVGLAQRQRAQRRVLLRRQRRGRPQESCRPAVPTGRRPSPASAWNSAIMPGQEANMMSTVDSGGRRDRSPPACERGPTETTNGCVGPRTDPRSRLRPSTGHRSLIRRGCAASTVPANWPAADRTTVSWPILPGQSGPLAVLQVTVPQDAMSPCSASSTWARRRERQHPHATRGCGVPAHQGVGVAVRPFGADVDVQLTRCALPSRLRACNRDVPTAASTVGAGHRARWGT